MSNAVPEGWEIRTLSDLADIDNKSLKNNTDPDYIFRYIDIASVKTAKVDVPTEYVSFRESPSRARKRVHKGDVLMSTVRPNLKSFAYFDVQGDDFVASTGFAVLTANKMSDSNFLYQSILSDSVTRQIESLVAGSNYPAISSANVKSLEVLAPPLPEQQKIATILSSVDDVIEKTRAQIDKLKDLKTGMMQELLTKGIGHTEFKDSPVGRIPAEWEVVTLEQICDPNAPITYGVLKPGNYVDGGRPLLQIKDLGEGTILAGGLHLIGDDLDYEYRRSRVQFGDIVISLVGTIGRTAMIPCWLNQPNIHRNLGRIRTRHNQYVFQFLQSESAKLQLGLTSAGSSQSALNLSALRQMSLPLPSPDEAQEITKILSSVDERIKVTTSRLNQLNNVKRALMQDLLTGKVRVKLTDKESAAV